MSYSAFNISGVRVTHNQVSIGELEAVSYEDWKDRLAYLYGLEDVAEAFVLQTCNRVEEYVVTDTSADGQVVLSGFADDILNHATIDMGHQESLRHLLRVAAGLESQVLGEDEILGQLRTAYRVANELGSIGPILEEGLLKAIHVGERARLETAINTGTVSLGSAAIKLADQECDLEESVVLVIGTGAMGERILKGLAEKNVGRLRLLNRTVESAESISADLHVPVTCDALTAFAEYIESTDIVISSTGSSEPIIHPGMVSGAGETVIIDLAQPRDVSPDTTEIPGVSLHDLDSLKQVTRRTHQERRDAVLEVEAIIDEEFDLLLDQYKRKRADAVIASMYQGAERIKQAQVSQAVSRLRSQSTLTEGQETVINELADSLVSQLLAMPTKSLRDAAANDDWETISTALELFDPELDADDAQDLYASFSVPDDNSGFHEMTPKEVSDES